MNLSLGLGRAPDERGLCFRVEGHNCWIEVLLPGGRSEATVFGSPTVENSQRALRSILSKVRAQDFDCFEVTAGHFLGIPYTTVAGHSRHLQQGCILQDVKSLRNAQLIRVGHESNVLHHLRRNVTLLYCFNAFCTVCLFSRWFLS